MHRYMVNIFSLLYRSSLATLCAVWAIVMHVCVLLQHTGIVKTIGLLQS